MWWHGRGNSGVSWLPIDKKANTWHGRRSSGGSWPPAFPRSLQAYLFEGSIYFKGVGVILSEPPLVEWRVQYTTVPSKPVPGQSKETRVKVKHHVYNLLFINYLLLIRFFTYSAFSRYTIHVTSAEMSFHSTIVFIPILRQLSTLFKR